MSFLWNCDKCGVPIIVDYESPKTMNPYASPFCPYCYNEERKVWYNGEDKSFEEYKQTNGYPIYQDQDGIIFYCQLAESDKLLNYLGKDLANLYSTNTDFQKIANTIYYNKQLTRKEILSMIANLLY